MRTGMIGSTDVAKTLARGFIPHGHDVMPGRRTPPKLSDWATMNPDVSTSSFSAAASFGEVLVRAVKDTVASEALHATGAANPAGRRVVDATNPIADVSPSNGVLKLFTSLDASLVEPLQGEFQDVRFVKAFNAVGNACMVNPQFEGGKLTMFIGGNDPAAKKILHGILDHFGWETADMGKVEAAGAVAPLCMLWCIPGVLRNDWVHAFELLT